MSLLRKRLEILEAAISPPDGRPFCIWGTIGDGTAGMRRKTDKEIQAEIGAALSRGPWLRSIGRRSSAGRRRSEALAPQG